MTKCKCLCCDWQGEESDVRLPIPDLFERLDDGVTVMPAGECPNCGSLAYNEDALAEMQLADAAPDLLAACEAIVNHIESLPDDTEKCRILKLSLNNRAGDMIRQAIAKAKGGAA